ncbi:hypothetical protein VNO77_18217 [Canavalia gladiata]|uniref:Uncharacterized protein n=1 Tax=Canavalia gladiata TaxID=3824 RepID=A0AAN9LKE8_CANGL
MTACDFSHRSDFPVVASEHELKMPLPLYFLFLVGKGNCCEEKKRAFESVLLLVSLPKQTTPRDEWLMKYASCSSMNLTKGRVNDGSNQQLINGGFIHVSVSDN